MPQLVTPMMASLRCGLPQDEDRHGWEFKWDGVRTADHALATANCRVVIRSDDSPPPYRQRLGSTGIEKLVHGFCAGGQNRPQFAPVDHLGGP
jgi:hypothetical protein